MDKEHSQEIYDLYYSLISRKIDLIRLILNQIKKREQIIIVNPYQYPNLNLIPQAK